MLRELLDKSSETGGGGEENLYPESLEKCSGGRSKVKKRIKRREAKPSAPRGLFPASHSPSAASEHVLTEFNGLWDAEELLVDGQIRCPLVAGVVGW